MKEITIPDFGKRLRAARLAAGFRRQAPIIARLGMERPHYYRIENGTRACMWKVAYRIIVGANLPLEYFYPKRMILDAARRIVESRRGRNGDE